MKKETGMLRRCFEEQGRLPPESEEGSNVEYKLKLHAKDPKNPQTVLRFQHYVSQLAWRLAETGLCFYELGVDDTGTIRGITLQDLETSLSVLEEMCRETESRTVHVERLKVAQRWVAEVTIEKVLANPSVANTSGFKRRCVAFLGPSQIGKSTLISTLCTHSLDVPSGHNRLRLLRHRHEIISGKSSGVSVDYLIYDANGKCIRSEEEFGAVSSELQNAPNVVQMVDLPGDAKYIKTVYAYLTQPTLDAVVLYDYPGKSSVFKEMLERLKIPVIDVNREDIDCCTGKGLETLKGKLFQELFALPCIQPFRAECTVEFVVENVYDGPEIGLVISGLVTRGSFTCGQALYLLDKQVTIRSIHRMRQPINTASSGQAVAVTLQNNILDASNILKGSLLCDGSFTRQQAVFRIKETTCGEGLLFIQGNRMTGMVKDETLSLNTPLPYLGKPQKYIFVRDDKISFGLCE